MLERCLPSLHTKHTHPSTYRSLSLSLLRNKGERSDAPREKEGSLSPPLESGRRACAFTSLSLFPWMKEEEVGSSFLLPHVSKDGWGCMGSETEREEERKHRCNLLLPPPPPYGIGCPGNLLSLSFLARKTRRFFFFVFRRKRFDFLLPPFSVFKEL